jgi:hypothetical protein
MPRAHDERALAEFLEASSTRAWPLLAPAEALQTPISAGTTIRWDLFARPCFEQRGRSATGGYRGREVRRISCDRRDRCKVSLLYTGELHTPTSLHSLKQQRDVALKSHAASVCFTCFRDMLQVFCLDVAKVDRDVACVAMVVHVCCKRMLPMFHMFFQTYVASVFIWCCICFTHMLQVFLSGCYVYLQWFSSVSGVFCKCFGRMSQVFHLSSDVRCNCCIWMFSKVDQADCCNCWMGVRGRERGAHATWG